MTPDIPVGRWQVAAEWQQLSLEVGLGEVARRLSGSPHRVVSQMGDGTAVLDRAGDLVERTVDLADRRVGARRRVEDVGVLRPVRLTAIGELDREPVLAERMRASPASRPGGGSDSTLRRIASA